MTHFGAAIVPDVNAKYTILSGSLDGAAMYGAGSGNDWGV
jgi:hypothetical protein